MGDIVDNLSSTVEKASIKNGNSGEGEGAIDPMDSDIVTPWTVQTSSATGVDYTKLIRKCVMAQENHILFSQNRFRIVWKPTCRG